MFIFSFIHDIDIEVILNQIKLCVWGGVLHLHVIFNSHIIFHIRRHRIKILIKISLIALKHKLFKWSYDHTILKKWFPHRMNIYLSPL